MRTLSSGPDLLHPVVLELHAKASYLVLKEEGRRAEPVEVNHFIDCWLSFLFHPALFYSLPGKQEGAESYRLEIFAAGEKLVRKYSEQQGENGAPFIRHWEEDFALLKTLSAAGKDKEEVPLYTPALAWQAGIAEQIFRLVQGHQDVFPGQEDFLAAGALYSAAGPALLLIRMEQYDAAKEQFASLEKKDEENNGDPFFAYGLAQVKMACGLHSLQQGRYEEAEKMLIDLLPLPLHSSMLERGLLVALDREDRYLDPDWLAVSVHVLSELHRNSSPPSVKRAFCSVLTHQAVLLHNEGAIESKVLLTSMKKAVCLNPGDAFARMTLDDAQMDAEIHALHQTMSAGKLGKASRIAQQSAYQGVVDQFFIFVAQVLEQIEMGDYPDDESACLMVRQLLEGAVEVDPEHRIIEDIALLLDEFEERLGIL
ncbi:MAG: hypothetical protein WGN25_14285 [Candidatus Electrothrix sp. GW3-4]|uniref:hypothetical protein n=1 Tax=Candidatus Electrothrix sp. GW3-4 TaxID=3126740 RepID=UPI0030D11528